MKRIIVGLLLLSSYAFGATFDQIPYSLTLGAGQSVRRNAGNSAFEAFTPLATGSILFTDLGFSGSNITSIASRSYNDLQDLPTLFTQSNADALYSVLGHTHSFASLTSKPTTLSGYGITDAQPLDSDLTAVAALTTDSFGRGLLSKISAANVRTYIGAGTSSFDGAFSSLSGMPTTLAGYGITDAQALDAQLTSLAALSYTGNTLKVVRVNAGETGFELATVTGGASLFNDLDFTGSNITSIETRSYNDLQDLPTLNAGDFVGPSSATDNAIVRFDGTTGKLGQNSSATIDDSGNLTANNVSGSNTGDQVVPVNTTSTASQYFTAYNSATGAFTKSLVAESDVTGLVADLALKAPLASPTFTGNPTAPTQSSSDNSTKLATTSYVTTGIANAVAAVNPAVAVQSATTAAGDTSGLTYSNGVSGIGATLTGSINTAITWDGYTFTTVGQRGLVKNDTQSPSGAFNGVYYVTQVQTVGLPPILTRALDYDYPGDINNTGIIPVVNGTVNASTSWLLTSAVATMGTDPLTYSNFTLAPSSIVNAIAGENYLSKSGNTITANAVNVSGTNVTGTLAAARMPGLTGDVTSSAGAVATTLANIPTGVPMAGSLLATAITAPGTPASGNGSIYVDSTSKNISVKDDAGVVKHGVQTKASTTSNYLTAINDAGSVSAAQPAFSDISGTASSGQIPTLNQNTTGSSASLSITGQTGLLTFTGPTSTNRNKAVRDAADTILELGGSYTPTGTWTSLTLVTPVLGTPTSGNLSNCTGLPVSGITSSTSTALGVGSIELGNASDCTLGRGVTARLTVEGFNVGMLTDDLGSFATTTSNAIGVGSINLGHASDTTITRVSSGVVAVEGINLLLTGGALGTPSSGTLTNCTFPTLNQDTTGSAVYWKTSGTGKGSITGPTAGTIRSYTFPNSDETILYSGGALGTPTSGTATNITGLPVSGITASTSTALGVGSIELGAASDTTIARSGAGAVTVEGVQVLLSGAALGTPASGVATNLTGTADGLTAGDVTRNHAVYAGASPPTVDVGQFTISKTGVDLKTAGTTTIFTVPSGRTFVCTSAWAVVTAVSGAGAGTETYQIKASTGSAVMTTATATSSSTPAVGKVFLQIPVPGSGPYNSAPAADNVQIVVSTSQAGSTSVTGTVFVQGFYSG